MEYHNNFEEELKNQKLTRGCQIEINNTLEIYKELCDAGFGFDRSSYTSPLGQSCFARYASNKYDVWFIAHNNVFVNDTHRNDSWTNNIGNEIIEEIWHIGNNPEMIDDYNEEIIKNTNRKRVVFVKYDEGLYVFYGIYTIARRINDGADKKVYFKIVSDTLEPIQHN